MIKSSTATIATDRAMAVDISTVLPKRQRAIKVVEAGALRLEKDAALPQLEDEDILVRVHSVALNPFDWYRSIKPTERQASCQILTPH